MPAERRLLYLEDEIIIALDTAQVLSEMGLGEVAVAHNLRRATALAEAERFDMALLDVNLGDDVTSLAFGRTLLAQGTDVIFASGYNSREMEAEHPDLVFIEKPLTAEVIRQALAQLSKTAGQK